MLVSTVRRAVVTAFIAGATLFGAGCYVDLDPPESVTVGYEPMYHYGYVVYFDTGGRPYCYIGGSVYWIPRSHAYYGDYVNHYNVYHRPYRHWYTHGGYRYKTYRRR